MELWWICEVSYGQFSVPFKMDHFLMAALGIGRIPKVESLDIAGNMVLV